MNHQGLKQQVAAAIREFLPSFSVGINNPADPGNAKYAQAIAAECADAALSVLLPRIEEMEGQLSGESVYALFDRYLAPMPYKGNSIDWWWSKAENYSRALGRAWEALSKAGIRADGEKDVAAGIRELVALSRQQGTGEEEA